MKKLFTKAQIVERDTADNSFTAIASTATVDRHGEIVSVEGWDLTNFKKNPVLLWSHDHTIPAIGKATKIWVEGYGQSAKLKFTGVWQTVTEEGRAAAELVAQGILNSFSVGFIPTDMEGNKYTQQELLEVSLVNVPANPDAVLASYKSLKDKGFSDNVAKTITQQFMQTGNVRKDLFSKERGLLQDELDAEAMWEAKRENMEDVWDIVYALCDVYFDEATPVEDFNTLVTEMIGILTKVADGTFDNSAEDPEDAEKSIKVVDKPTKQNETEDNQAKVPSATAPKTNSQTVLRSRQSLTKAIVKATDKLLEDKSKQSNEESVKLIKAIKRAGEILSQSHKGELRNGTTSRTDGEES